MNNIIYTKTEIPVSYNNYFIIKKSDHWKFSIEITFNPLEEINIFNLFNILKSYAWNTLAPCYQIAFSSMQNDTKLIIFEKESLEKIKKINLIEFTEWILWRLNNDRKYKTIGKFYSILIQFEKNIINEKEINLNKLFPKYPWEKKWMDFLKINQNKTEYLENRIKELEEIIKKK